MVGNVTDGSGVSTAAAWSSADATTWKRLSADAQPRSFMTGVVPMPAGAVAVGYTLDGEGLVWTATDATTWVSTAVPGATFNDVAMAAGKVLVLGRTNGAPTTWTGSDGDASTWQATTVAAAGIPQFLAVSPAGIEVAEGIVFDRDGTATLTVWQSPDGVSWTPVVPAGLLTGPTAASALEWTPAGFVMAVTEYPKGKAAGSLWSSADGLAWQRAMDVPEGTVTAVGTAGDAALAIGAGETWRSLDGLTWLATPEQAFRGSLVAAVTTLPNGDMLAAGQQSRRAGGTTLASWTGTLAVSSNP